jgi:hypothetical protein
MTVANLNLKAGMTAKPAAIAATSDVVITSFGICQK